MACIAALLVLIDVVLVTAGDPGAEVHDRDQARVWNVDLNASWRRRCWDSVGTRHAAHRHPHHAVWMSTLGAKDGKGADRQIGVA
jgi:hypothetical protein